MEKDKLKEIYQIVTDITHGEIEKEAVLREAVKIYITEKINGFPKKQGVESSSVTGEAQASEKQKALLNKLGYVPKDNMTMKEASVMIKEKLDG